MNSDGRVTKTIDVTFVARGIKSELNDKDNNDDHDEDNFISDDDYLTYVHKQCDAAEIVIIQGQGVLGVEGSQLKKPFVFELRVHKYREYFSKPCYLVNST